mgnify:CR=1 FL=1
MNDYLRGKRDVNIVVTIVVITTHPTTHDEVTKDQVLTINIPLTQTYRGETMKELNDFILFPRLENELKYYLENPTEIDYPLCFYGVPGIGKTSFARYLTNKYSHDVTEYDSSNDMFSIIPDIDKKMRGGSLCPFMSDEDKPFDRGIIIDEFHDFTDVRQDKFKKILEEITCPPYNSLVIICLNTDSNNPIEKRMTPAIRSRCDLIDFTPNLDTDNPDSDIEPMINQLNEKYPELSLDFLVKTYPDLRKIMRRVERLR